MTKIVSLVEMAEIAADKIAQRLAATSPNSRFPTLIIEDRADFGGACGCLGPQNGDPLCPCAMAPYRKCARIAVLTLIEGLGNRD